MSNQLKNLLSTEQYQHLFDHFNDVYPFSPAEYEALFAQFYLRKVKKGEHIFEQGRVPTYGGYILYGAVRYYCVTENGDDITINFLFEGDCVSDCHNALHQSPITYNAVAIEDCTLICLHRNSYEELINSSPAFANFYIVKKELQTREQIDRLVKITGASAQERYAELLNTRPEVLLRVPQRFIASFLGIHSHSLSRLKKEFVPNL